MPRNSLISTVLPTPRRPVKIRPRSGSPRLQTFQQDVERANLLGPAGELGRALSRAGRVGIDRCIHVSM